MRGYSDSASARHVLLRPVNLRLAAGAALPKWLADQLEPEESEDEYLVWDALEPEELSSTDTWPAFWQLLGMVEASGGEITDFTSQWGMLSTNWQDYERSDSFTLDKPEAMYLGDWHSFANTARQLLALVVLTAEEEVVPSEMLEVIQHWDELPDWPDLPKDPDSLAPEELNKVVALLREAPFVRAQMRWDALTAERAEGRALEQQRRIAVHALNGLLGMQYARFGWDARGRRMEREAFGLDDVVFSHIATIFSAPELDVLICSICGKPYYFDEAGSGRRPRFGVRRFCSDACRRVGKRESNRLSWHRNGARWRRTPSTRRASEEKPNGSQG